MNKEQRDVMVDALEQAYEAIHVARFDKPIMDNHYGGILKAKSILDTFIEELNGIGSRVLYSTDDRYKVKYPIGGER